MTRTTPPLLLTRTVLAFAALAVLAPTTVQARRREPAAAPAKTGATPAKGGVESTAPGKPTLVDTYGDWGAYLAKGKSRTCYALATPKERKPDGKKDGAYVFIADRPAEKVHNEVSIMMGFPIKESGAAQAKVGSSSFDLVAKGSNAWIKNPGDEAKFVEALKHTGRMTVSASPMKGKPTVDIYSLAGVRQALDRVTKECK